MTQAKIGDTVHVHYTGTLSDGSEFDSSRDRDPLEFTIGQQQVIPGFEKAVEGMAVGDTNTLTIPADEAYGERRDDLLLKVDPSQFPAGVTPEVGQQFEIRQNTGQTIPVTVAAVETDGVTLDANHPLAGQDLTFEITLVKVA